ncbi:MAG: O-antigen ligase family protein [Dehalococcoidia bacterium]|nr:O-antigen ligase family protein [Dehalococcoidia bacterium]
MRSPSADLGQRAGYLARRPAQASQQAWLYLLTVVGAATATVGGALAAVSPNLAFVAVVGMIGASCLALLSSALSLMGLLTIRSLTDASATTPIVAGLNAGAVLGLVVIASAGALVVTRLIEKRQAVRGLMASVVVTGMMVYWFGIGVLHYGMDESLIRELVRAVSIVAVALIAANSDRSVTASRMGTIVVVAALIPAILVVNEAVTHWPEMVGGGLRPRGTMSHPNAAAILFGIAAPVAVWKFAHDGGGKRYLWAAGFFVFAVLLTRSLGGLAQTTVGLLALGALQQGGSRLFRVGVFVAVAAIAYVFIADPLGISRVSELESTTLQIQQGAQDNNSFEWRLVNWSLFLDKWQESRLLGFGLGTTDEIIAPLGHLPHSDPVRFLVETGILGVSLISVGVLLLVNRLVLLAKVGPDGSFAITALAVVCGVGTHMLVTHVSFNTAPVYVLAALLGWLLSRQPEVVPEEDRASQRRAHRLLDATQPQH